jgi:(E)-4-hydroxy-3-methylbut-2-enyl-diphosphate synthase
MLFVGKVALGGGAPIPVQSMLTTSTRDIEGSLQQIIALEEVGCEIVRVAVESKRDLESFASICAGSPLPVVADIHFDYRLAIEAAKKGAAKLRINPGNIGSIDKVDAVIDAAGEAGIPVRIGVNSGSLEERVKTLESMNLATKMVVSVDFYAEHFKSRGFKDMVLSAKASDVNTTIEVYRMLSKSIPDFPLHLGVTEAGTTWQGSIRSAVGIGTLLAEGIGDTFRVSLTAEPEEEIRVSRALLATLNLGALDTATLISCPTCSRCKVDLIGMANQVEKRLATVKKPLKVAVMGCVVNGPGEAAEADIGVACGQGTGAIFAHGEVLYTVPEDHIIDALFNELQKLL